MAIFKRGDVYWFNFWWRGEHVQCSRKQGNPRVTRKMEAAYRTKLAKGEVGIDEPKHIPPFKEFEQRFREAMRTLREARPKTIEYYENGLDGLLEFEPLRDSRLDKVDEALIASYIAKRKADKKRGGKPEAGQKRKASPYKWQRSIVNLKCSADCSASRMNGRLFRTLREFAYYPENGNQNEF